MAHYFSLTFTSATPPTAPSVEPPFLSMTITKHMSIDVTQDGDISRVRRAVRREAEALGFGGLDCTRLVTAASELTRNLVTYGGGGSVDIEHVESTGEQGLRLVFGDDGPGIEDIDAALDDGFTTGRGLGLGLGGAQRLVDDFEIESSLGEGTTVTLTRWLHRDLRSTSRRPHRAAVSRSPIMRRAPKAGRR